MRRLRRYIRSILHEDLGQQVWADRAPTGSRHHGTEEDTPEEHELWKMVDDYVNHNHSMHNQKAIDRIKEYMNDPRYNDVFIDGNAEYVVRGLSSRKDAVEKVIGMPLPEYNDIKKEVDTRGWMKFDVNMAYIPEDWDRDGITSSWTSNWQVANQFARAQQSLNHKAVIFHAIVKHGDFLDLDKIYNWEGMYEYSVEEELLALGPIQVKTIYVWYPEANDGRWSGPPILQGEW